MAHGYISLRGSLLVASLAGSAGCTTVTVQEEDAVGVASQALSVCDETVPANRNVDGIPAYAQCADSSDSAIYSNNGVDTSTTQMGSDWVRTQWSGGYQCTELAHRYLYFRWQVKWIPNGNAGFWCDSQPPANSGVVQTMSPVHGDIMVLAPGSCGADPTTGHVNVIDAVNGEKLVAVEQNGARRGNYQLSCAKCFLHVMANDGTPAPASGVGAAGSSGAITPTSGAAGSQPMQGPAGPGWGRPPSAAEGAGRPASEVPPAKPAAAGAAAPDSMAGSAGHAASGRSDAQRAATSSPLAPSAAAAGARAVPPTTLASVVAGSVARSPATLPVASTRMGAPTQSACSIGAAPGAPRRSGVPLGLMLSGLLGITGYAQRRIRRRPNGRARRGD